MIIDVIVVLAFVGLVALGFIRGIVKSAVMLVSIPITIVASLLLASPITAFLNYTFGFAKAVAGWFNTTKSNGKILAVIIVAVVVFVAIRLVFYKLTKMSAKAQENKKLVGKVDKWLGAAFGVLRFFIYFTLAAVAFRLITVLPFVGDKLHKIVFDDSKVALWLYNLVIKVIFLKAMAAAGSMLP